MHLFDANTFMESMRTYYPIDVAPAYWAWLVSAHDKRQLASVEAVYDEIVSGNQAEDELIKWAKSTPSTFWMPDTVDSLHAVTLIGQWANDPARPYNDAARSEFMDSADLRLIAQAHVIRGVVVTREVAAPTARKRVKIPDACEAFGIDCSQPFPVYRQLGLKLS